MPVRGTMREIAMNVRRQGSLNEMSVFIFYINLILNLTLFLADELKTKEAC